MLKIGQKVTLPGEAVEEGLDDVAIVDGFLSTENGYVVLLFYPNGKSAQ